MSACDLSSGCTQPSRSVKPSELYTEQCFGRAVHIGKFEWSRWPSESISSAWKRRISVTVERRGSPTVSARLSVCLSAGPHWLPDIPHEQHNAVLSCSATMHHSCCGSLLCLVNAYGSVENRKSTHSLTRSAANTHFNTHTRNKKCCAINALSDAKGNSDTIKRANCFRSRWPRWPSSHRASTRWATTCCAGLW